MILNKDINSAVLKSLSEKELRQLCGEIRRFLIKTVSRTGGHLSSNLGTVELTVALHKVFDSPADKFVFDVGHQAYTHKILTGRFGRFSTLRSKDGISGFPRRGESEHDAFIGGHSGIAVSAAFGIAEALRMNGESAKTIAVIGDGSLTDGGTFEGLNNAGRSKANLLVILNDNEMSISKNTGAIAAYLTHLRASRGYYTAKVNVKNFLDKNPVGEAVGKSVSVAKKFVKYAVYQSKQGNFFENLGFKYYGIVDGHNLRDLTEVLELAKLIHEPCLIHVKTKKGKGLKPAERNPAEFHGLNKTDVSESDEISQPKPATAVSCSEIFGREIARLGAKDDRIVLISAAMKYATGCNYFNDDFPERFYDCGIAESHAATFAAGLSTQGLLPVFAVYSTFSQRAFDRFLHDIAIEKSHVVLAIDRAGLVGEDGETHQGVFDAALLSMIPGFAVYSPSTPQELRECLYKALYEEDCPVAVRYPRGTMAVDSGQLTVDSFVDFRLFARTGSRGRLAVTYGRLGCLVFDAEGLS
ncbi:MAG: 1-deoxy-D-xylulose-5-phosphate synthase, partial [Oscillospiraceae bacterium]|nr:1-deoxy-D-xylulose-5-phosphate synthase [Oscillospiraceae bacterium]